MRAFLMQVIQVMRVSQEMQIMQVMQVSLAHLWVDFRVIFFVLFLGYIIIFNCCAVFDKDRSGFASSSEIKAVMANLGVHFTDDEITEMMLEVGPEDLSVEPLSSKCWAIFFRRMSMETTRWTLKSSRLWWPRNKGSIMETDSLFSKTLPSVHQQQIFA